MNKAGEIRYRGRTITQEDIEFVRSLIAEHPEASRRRLSEELCRAWNWRQPNGELRAMVARGLIGWSQDLRRRNIHLLAYNTRYLILPWAKVPCLASHVLAQMARRISRDWETLYRHPIHFLETFVDPERFRGTCYRAANWIRLGVTTGRGKDEKAHKVTRTLKEVWGYALSRDFRAKLCGER